MFLAALIQAPFRSKARPRRQGGLRRVDTLAGRPYILGNELTAADIQLSFVGELAAARFGITDYSNVGAWIKRFQARPAYQTALSRGGAYSFA